MSPTQQLILETLAYFSASAGWPLTRDELWSRLHGVSADGAVRLPANLTREEFDRELGETPGLGRVADFVFLTADGESVVWQRLHRERLARTKWELLRRHLRPLAGSPAARLLLASGSLSLRATRESSDLDILVLSERGKLWTARGELSLRSLLRGSRRIGKLEQDKLCFNHFSGESELGPRSFYTAHLYSQLVPIAGDPAALRDFVRANAWIRGFLPHFAPNPNVREDGFGVAPGLFSEFFFPAKPGKSALPESAWRGIQRSFRLGKLALRRIPGLGGVQARRESDARIVMTERELCFHEIPQEPRALAAWEMRVHEIISKGLTGTRPLDDGANRI